MDRMKDKIAVLTGGASGVGLGCAKKILEEGGTVLIADISEEILKKADDLKAAYGDRVMTVVASCCSEDDMAMAMKLAVDTFGRIDTLINCAGISGRGPIDEMPLESWESAIAVTLTGTFIACRAAVPYMKQRHYGRIVNIASVGGRGKRGVNVSYSASKNAVMGLTRGLAMELREEGITVNSVAPGPLNSGPFYAAPGQERSPQMAKAVERLTADVVFHRLGEVSEVAHAVVYLASDEASWTTGDCLDVNGGCFMQN